MTSKISKQNKRIQELTNEVSSLRRELETTRRLLKKRWEADEQVKHELLTGQMGFWFCGGCNLILPDSMLTDVCMGQCPGIDGRFRSLCGDCILKAPLEKQCTKCESRLCEICWDELSGVCTDCPMTDDEDGEAGEEEA